MSGSAAIGDGLEDPAYIDIPIFCGPVIKREISKGICSSYVDITYVDNVSVESIPLYALIFQNYYTSSISISHNSSNNSVTNGVNSSSAPCYILEDKKLMESSYFEKDGNKWCEVYASEFNSQFVHRKSFRINLFQPANTWANFEIRNIKAVGLAPQSGSLNMHRIAIGGSSAISGNGVGSSVQNTTALLKSDGNTILQMVKRHAQAAAPGAPAVHN